MINKPHKYELLTSLFMNRIVSYLYKNQDHISVTNLIVK